MNDMRCIDADALKEKAWDAKTQCGYVQVVDVGDIDDAPTIEPERKVGKWIRCDTDGSRNMCKCSECGARIDIQEEFRSFFCYHCGIKMEGCENNV